MSLEQQIETLNGNFVTLIALLSNGEVPKAAGKKKAAATEQVTQPTTSPPADKQNSPVASSNAAAQESAASTAPLITADAITKVIIALCAKDKPACLKVLETFGVKRGGELKPEQLADAHKALTAKLDELVKL
jgi:hypothetical protein